MLPKNQVLDAAKVEKIKLTVVEVKQLEELADKIAVIESTLLGDIVFNRPISP